MLIFRASSRIVLWLTLASVITIVACSAYTPSSESSEETGVTQAPEPVISETDQQTALMNESEEKLSPQPAVAQEEAPFFSDPLVTLPTADSVHPLTNAEQTRWIYDFSDPGLVRLIHSALERNADLIKKAKAVREAAYSVIAEGFSYYPHLSSYQPSTDSEAHTRTDDASGTLDWQGAGFQAALWNELTEDARQVNLEYAWRKSEFAGYALSFTTEIAHQWYLLHHHRRLQALLLRREDTLKNALTVLEQKYENKLIELDALVNFRTQMGALAEQINQHDLEQSRIQSILTTLTGLSEDEAQQQLSSSDHIFSIRPVEPDQLDSLAIGRLAGLNQAWLSLLAHSPARAEAVRQRFPKIPMNPSLDQSFDWDYLRKQMHADVSAESMKHSENGGVNQEEGALYPRGIEQVYFSRLFDAFADVENNLLSQQSLLKRYKDTLQQLHTERGDTETALEKFQAGHAPLEFLLEVQNRMLNTEARALDLLYQRTENRIELYRLMGGALFPVTIEKSAF